MKDKIANYISDILDRVIERLRAKLESEAADLALKYADQVNPVVEFFKNLSAEINS